MGVCASAVPSPSQSLATVGEASDDGEFPMVGSVDFPAKAKASEPMAPPTPTPVAASVAAIAAAPAAAPAAVRSDASSKATAEHASARGSARETSRDTVLPAVVTAAPVTSDDGARHAIVLTKLSPADAAAIGSVAPALDYSRVEGSVAPVTHRCAMIDRMPHVHTKFCPRKKNVCPFAAGHLKSAAEEALLLEGETLVGSVRMPGGANLASGATAYSTWYRVNGGARTLVARGRAATMYHLNERDIGCSLAFGCAVLSAPLARHALLAAAGAMRRRTSATTAQNIAMFAFGETLISPAAGPVGEANCAVHNIWIEGRAAEGETLSVYADYFGGVQGADTVCWWMRVTPQGKRELLGEHARLPSRSDTTDGGAALLLDTLTLSADDIGCKLKFNCRPRRADGQEGAVATTRPTVAVTAADTSLTKKVEGEQTASLLRRGRPGPTAAEIVRAVRAKGARCWREGAVVAAQIEEECTEHVGEKTLMTRPPPGFAWCRRRVADGHLVVTGGTQTFVHKLTSDDVGCMLCFVYASSKGAARSGGALPAIEFESAAIGPILPAPPLLEKPKLSGRAVEGSVLKASAEYSGWREGATRRWWRRIAPPGPQAGEGAAAVIVDLPPLSASEAFERTLAAADSGCCYEAHWRARRIDGVWGSVVSSAPSRLVKLASPSISTAAVSIIATSDPPCVAAAGIGSAAGAPGAAPSAAIAANGADVPNPEADPEASAGGADASAPPPPRKSSAAAAAAGAVADNIDIDSDDWGHGERRRSQCHGFIDGLVADDDQHSARVKGRASLAEADARAKELEAMAKATAGSADGPREARLQSTGGKKKKKKARPGPPPATTAQLSTGHTLRVEYSYLGGKEGASAIRWFRSKMPPPPPPAPPSPPPPAPGLPFLVCTEAGEDESRIG